MTIFRNRGFEQGDLEFWEQTGDGTLVIDSAGQKYGTYCGKVALANMEKTYIENVDYIPVNINQPLIVSAWVNTLDAAKTVLQINQFDEGLNLIDNSMYGEIRTDVGYKHILQSITPLPSTSYIKAGVRIWLDFTACDVFLDSMVIQRISGDTVIKSVCNLADVLNATVSSDTSSIDSRMDGFNDYWAELKVTALTGTAPTQDVTVCELDTSGIERVLATFAQVNAPATERVTMTVPVGTNMYVRNVKGGVCTDFDFTVNVIGRR